MLPVTSGIETTKKNILIYSVLLFPVALAPFYLKFYNNDSLYPLKKINSVDMNSVNVSFSKTKGIDLISDGSIDYTNIQGIKFGKD